MNEILHLPADLQEKAGLVLILTKDRARQSKTRLIARLLQQGSLLLVAADEWLPGYALPRQIRSRTTEVKNALGRRLRTIGAATSLRLLDSLSGLPASGEPLLVLELLHTFYDPDVNLSLRFRVLRQCCDHLQRIARRRPVMVMMREMPGREYDRFLPLLRGIAQRTLLLEPAPARMPPSQPPLL